MQTVEQNSPLKITSTKVMSENPKKCEFLEGQAIIGVVTEVGLEIYRVKPQFERISLINTSELNNAGIRDFIIDPVGQLIIISTDKPKVQVFKLTEDEDRRPYIIFNDADTAVKGFRVMQSGFNIKSSYHSFQRIHDRDINMPEASYSVVEKIFKSSFTHLFTIKENLNKIQKLESLIDIKNQIYFLYCIDGLKIKASLNSLIDLFTLDLSEFIEGTFEILSIDSGAEIDKLNILVKSTMEEGRINVSSVCFKFDQLSDNIDEVFCLNYSLALVKEFLLNLKLGFFNAKTKFKEIGKKVQAFIGEMNIDEVSNLEELRWFIKFGYRSTENLPSFFEILDMKKLAEFHQFVLQNFGIVEDFVSESLKPGLSKILVILEDTKRINSRLNINSQSFIDVDAIDTFINSLRVLSKAIDQLLYRITDKKLEILNFFLFLFKWKMKSSANLKYNENPEYLKYYNALLDFKLLIKYLSSYSSICLEDLSAACESEIIVVNNENETVTEVDPKTDDQFKNLYKQLGLSPLNDRNDNQDKNMIVETGECIKDLFRKVDGGLVTLMKSLKSSFLNNIRKTSSNILIPNLVEVDIFDFSCNNKILLGALDRSGDQLYLIIKKYDHTCVFTLKLPHGLGENVSNFEFNSRENELVFSLYNKLENIYDIKFLNLNLLPDIKKPGLEDISNDQSKHVEVIINETNIGFKTDFSFKGINSIRFNQEGMWLVVRENQLSILD